MKDNKGITMIALVVTIIVMAILTGIVVNSSSKHIKKAELQDYVTNMLLIQAKAKIGVEEVVFKTVNLDKNKEEEFKKIEDIKNTNLIGKKYLGGITQIDDILGSDNTEEWYYLEDEDLEKIGLYELIDISDKKQYYIYTYDENTLKIEVIYTGGYIHSDEKIYYTLSDLEKLQNS